MNSATVSMPLVEIDNLRDQKTLLEKRVKELEDNERSLVVKVVTEETSYYNQPYVIDCYGRRRYEESYPTVTKVVSYKNLDDIMGDLIKKAEEVTSNKIKSLNAIIQVKDGEIREYQRVARESADTIKRLEEREDLEQTPLVQGLRKTITDLHEKLDSFWRKDWERKYFELKFQLEAYMKRGFWRRLFNLSPKEN